MFVQGNSLKDVLAYFQRELSSDFSENELRLMVKELAFNRLSIRDLSYIDFGTTLLSESDLLFFRDAVKRLKKEEPFQYILETSLFYDLELISDSRALIPRPETEELVHWIVSDYPKDAILKILDICAGSGCIALALKSNFVNADVVALEWSSEAIALIEDNKKTTGLNINVAHSDALELQQAKLGEGFDVWVSNPPYIPVSDKVLMAKNVLEHEPDMALFVENDDPMLFYREISISGMKLLKENGALYFEIHERYGRDVIALLENLGFVNIEMRKDLQGKDRMIKAIKVSSQNEFPRGKNQG